MRLMAIWRGLKSFGARDFCPENITVGGTKVPRSDQKHPPDKIQFGAAFFGTRVHNQARYNFYF